MIERDGKVIVEVIPSVSAEVLIKIVKDNVKRGSQVYTDQFSSYSSLFVNGYGHIKVDKEKRFANGKTHINTIESFWAYVKEHLAKFHGIKPQKLFLYLTELEFRFNNRHNKDLVTTLITYLGTSSG